MPQTNPLLTFTDKGIYCPKAGVYIDPWKPVEKALITHGHADHARRGHKSYLCSESAAPVIRVRLGPKIKLETIPYHNQININGVSFSFHPAGHIIGSAQIRVAWKDQIWVASGDYKTENDGISETFEPVPCSHFITESTFGLPVYRWQPQTVVFDEINKWWRHNQSQGKVSLITAYSLGKAQRILANIDNGIGRVFTHGAVEALNEVIRAQGFNLPETTLVDKEVKRSDLEGGLVIAPPAAIGTSWVKKLNPYSHGIASGWMTLRGARRRMAADRGFVLSDHADWEGLQQAIEATGAENIYVTHGYKSQFSNWLKEQGYHASTVETMYEGEQETPEESSTNSGEGV